MKTMKCSEKAAKLKLIAVLPLIAAIMVFSMAPGNGKASASAPSVMTEIQKDSIVLNPQVMPQFPGGEKALIEFISKNLKYPEEAKKSGIQGRIMMKFCVTAKGAVSEVQVLKKVNPALDAEAIRVVKMIPQFVPAKDKGKNVSTWYMLPVEFKLN